MRGLGFFFFFNPSLCTCFAELSSLLPCPTVEVSLNNKTEEGKFASALAAVKLDTVFFVVNF